VPEARAVSNRLRESGRVGFVPTMGALHAGHESLVRQAHGAADAVVLSVFVNPLQFGPGEDFHDYPRDLDRDADLASGWGVAVFFAPEAGEFTPPEAQIMVDPGPLGEVLEGRFRPGHFRGVLTIVAKLLNVLQPDVAVFGQKDFQQALLVQAMVRDLEFPTRIDVAPTVREPDGLALSSRNTYLSNDERVQAGVLYHALTAGQRAILEGDRSAASVRETILSVLSAAPALVPDYVVVARAADLAEADEIRGPTVLAIAARLGGTRLIDNVLVDPEKSVD
jgi:pantoate--beta-alanine ligase